jgi:hypothetical protein
MALSETRYWRSGSLHPNDTSREFLWRFERDSARTEKQIFDFAMALPAGPTYMDAQRQAA